MDVMFLLTIKPYIYLFLVISFFVFIAWSQHAAKQKEKVKVQRSTVPKMDRHRFIP